MIKLTENIRETLRNNLTIYINRSSITQKNLAEQLGVSKGAVTNWLNGSNSPNIEILAKICQILGVKMSEMLSDNSEISADEKEWFKKYHKLNNHGKKVVNAVLDIEYEYYMKEKQPNLEEIHTQTAVRAARSDTDKPIEVVELSEDKFANAPPQKY